MPGRSLPDLIARLLLDRSDFTAGVAASVRDVAGLDAAANRSSTGLLSLGAAHRSAGSSAKAHAAEVRTLENSIHDAERAVGIFERTLGSLGVAGESGVGRAAQSLSGLTGNLGPAGAAIGLGLGGTAAIAGVGVVIDELAKKQAELGFRVLATSDALGLQTGELQGLEKWGERYGIATDTMDTQLFRFNKTIGEGAPLLKAQGYSLEELGITSKDTATAYLQTADAVSKISDAQQRAVIVQGLFGKGGEAQLTAMQQGSAAITAYIKKLEDYGVILDKATLQQDAAAKSAREDLGLALQGLENQFVAPLEQGFLTLDIVVTKMASNGKDGMHAFGQAVSSVIGDVASLLNGLFGLGITNPDLARGQKEMIANLNSTGQTFASTKGQAKDYQQQISENIRELTREVSEYDRGIDAKIRNEQELQKELDLRVQLRAEQRTAAADAAAITKTTGELNLATVQGDTLKQMSLGAQLTTEKQKQADDQLRDSVNAQKRESQGRIDAWTDEKKVTDENYRLRIQQQQDLATAAKASNASMASDATFTAGAITNVFGGTTVTLSKKFEQLGIDIKKFLADPFSTENQDKLAADAAAMGMKIGAAILGGIAKGAAQQAQNDIQWKGLNDYLKSLGGRDLGTEGQEPALAKGGPGDVGDRSRGGLDFLQAERQAGKSRLDAILEFNTRFMAYPTQWDLSTTGFAAGGILREPVIGRGMHTGNSYSFAETGPEEFGGVGKVGQGRGGNTYGDIIINVPGYLGSLSDLQMAIQKGVADVLHA